MAEFIGEKDKNINIGEPVVFENKTDSAFEVSAGVVFHKSGIYEVSVLKNKTIVSKVTERKKGEWIDEGDPLTLRCSKCGYRVARHNNTNFCPNCGNYKRDEEE